MEPLIIATFIERSLHLDVEPLCQLLLQPKFRDFPVIIISINGRMRTGKTFLLNKIASFLKAGGILGWIDFPLEFELEWNDSEDGVTSGIQIYPEVLPLTVGKQKIAVILMDTQGTFDGSNLSDTYKIFGLSSLISSVIIYNDIVSDKQNFQRLHGFIKFTQFASADDSKNGDLQFGKLTMLFRDWGHVSQFPYGFYSQQDSDKHLWQRLINREKLTPESEYFRNSILKTFQDVGFHTMAGPGSKLPNLPEYRQSTEWDPSFRDCVIDFVENLFSQSYLEGAVKSVGGKVIKAKNYVSHIRSWADVMSNNGYNLVHLDVIDSSAEIYYNGLLGESWEMYKDEFVKFRCRDFIGNVDDFHKITLDLVEKQLWANVSFNIKKAANFEKLLEMANKFLGNVKPIIYKAQEERKKEAERKENEKNKRRKQNVMLGVAAIGVGGATGGLGFLAFVLGVTTFVIGKGLLSIFSSGEQHQERRTTVEDWYIPSSPNLII